MPNQWGFGKVFEGDTMMQGTSLPCFTFNSPSLSKLHSGGSGLNYSTSNSGVGPCISVKEAEVMEYRQLLLAKCILR